MDIKWWYEVFNIFKIWDLTILDNLSLWLHTYNFFRLGILFRKNTSALISSWLSTKGCLKATLEPCTTHRKGCVTAMHVRAHNQKTPTHLLTYLAAEQRQFTWVTAVHILNWSNTTALARGCAVIKLDPVLDMFGRWWWYFLSSQKDKSISPKVVRLS